MESVGDDGTESSVLDGFSLLNNLDRAMITSINAAFGKSIVLSSSLDAAVSTALTSVPKFTSSEESIVDWLSTFGIGAGILVDLVLENSTRSASWRVPSMITQAVSSVGPRAMPKLRSALRHKRFRVFKEIVPSSTDPFLSRSGWLTRLSTLSRPLALLNILEPCRGGVAIGAWLEVVVKTFGGTAALPKVVRKASRGVERRSSPATWANL